MGAFFYPDSTHMWNGSSMTEEQIEWNGKIYDRKEDMHKARMLEHARNMQHASDILSRGK